MSEETLPKCWYCEKPMTRAFFFLGMNSNIKIEIIKVPMTNAETALATYPDGSPICGYYCLPNWVNQAALLLGKPGKVEPLGRSQKGGVNG